MRCWVQNDFFIERLEGYDKDWLPASNQPYKIYENLPHGNYTFKVKARNVYGVESQEAHFKFVILPPWYRTTLAIISYVIGLIILLWIALNVFAFILKMLILLVKISVLF